jgi:hypothetical protein
MRGYLSPVGRDSEIPVEGVTEVYRDPGDSQQVMVETDGRPVPVGVADPTVSRKKGDDAPVRLVPHSESIEVQNRGNTNGVAVDPSGRDVEIDEGHSRRIQNTTVVQIGYQTRLKLTVEREKRFGHVEGDVMLGGTKVEDAVVGPDARIGDGGANASEANAPGANADSGGGPTRVDDSVVGPDAEVGDETEVTDSVVGPRASVGGDGDTDTESFCATHQRTYSGEACPACASGSTGESAGASAPGGSSAGPAGSGASSRSPDGGDGETKFCIYCGTSIPSTAQVCSSCGESQPDV